MARIYSSVLFALVLACTSAAVRSHGAEMHMTVAPATENDALTGCYLTPTLPSCASFEIPESTIEDDITTLCSSMPDMLDCQLWDECQVRFRMRASCGLNNPTWANGMRTHRTRRARTKSQQLHYATPLLSWRGCARKCRA